MLWQFDVQGELPSGEGTTVALIPDARAHENDTCEAEIVSTSAVMSPWHSKRSASTRRLVV